MLQARWHTACFGQQSASSSISHQSFTLQTSASVQDSFADLSPYNIMHTIGTTAVTLHSYSEAHQQYSAQHQHSLLPIRELANLFLKSTRLWCRWLIAHANLFVAWLFNVLYSSALVYLSTWTVVNIAPQAAGAGVAEVTAYLNGCNLPKVLLSPQHLLTSQVASVCCCCSELPVACACFEA